MFQTRWADPGEHRQRLVRGEEYETTDGEQDETAEPHEGGALQPSVDRGTAEDGRKDEDGKGEKGANAKHRRRREATGGAVGVYAGCPQHFELHTAPDGVAGREDVSDGIAYDAGADNGEPAIGPQEEPLQGECAAKTGRLRQQCTDHPYGAEGGQARPRPDTLARLGRTT